jgi:hypothetical protein
MTDPVLPTGASQASGPTSSNTQAEPSTAAIKRRQVLLVAGIAGTIVVGTLLSVSLTGTKRNDAQPAKPRSVNILAPGTQVDPRDAWRGQADAQMKAIEQRSRDVAQRNAELEGQGKAMLERLKKLEGSGLTPLPPPPLSAPAERPSFGPDGPANASPDSGPQRFPPPPPPLSQGAVSGAGLPPPPGGVQSLSSPIGIVSIALGDVAAGTGAKLDANAASATATHHDTRRYLPSGAFTRAVLLGGLNAPTGGQAQQQPPAGPATPGGQRDQLPNQFRARGQGLPHRRRRLRRRESSERAYIRTESLSCVSPRRYRPRRTHQGLRGRRRRQGRHDAAASSPSRVRCWPMPCIAGIGSAASVKPSSKAPPRFPPRRWAPPAPSSPARSSRQVSSGVGKAHRPPRPVLHQPRREALPGGGDRCRPQRGRGAHAGRRPASSAGSRRCRSRQPRATRRARPHPPEER